jgi:RimJ/RimL family protein N-acetyltransferase
MRHGERGDDGIHHVDFQAFGLTRVTPINPDTYAPERMEWLWEKIKTQDYAFDDFSRNDPVVFALQLADKGSLHFEVGDSAYVVLKGLLQSDNPSIHFCVWDKDLAIRDVLQVGREIIDFSFKRLKVHRITASMPVYNRQAIKFATLLGFRFEGELRDAILYHDKHHNVRVYGLLRDDWQRGTLSRLGD